MPVRVSNILGVSHDDLQAEGAFDSFVDIDALFYIDPHLLPKVGTPELKGSYARFTKHFEGVLHLLEASKKPDDFFWGKALNRLIFREHPYIGLGYSSNKKNGSGIGLGLARQMVETAAQIVNVGIKDPLIFELAGLLEDGIGADRISDMTTSIIMPDLLRFSERVARKLHLPTRPISYKEGKFALLSNPQTGLPIILVPTEILTPLPVSFCFDCIDSVSAHNAALRDRVNNLVGNVWGQRHARMSKQERRDAILSNPALLREILQQYREQPSQKYDFVNDPTGEVIWYETAQDYAQRFPLNLTGEGSLSAANIQEVVMKICHHFRMLVQNNGLWSLFYDDQRVLKHERAAQLLFFGIADAYCQANNLDLSREPNAGRGPVDFKLSRGYHARVNVEVKYTSNKQLAHGFEKQLPIYNEAEKTTHSIFLVIKTTENNPALERVKRLHQQEVAKGNRVPEFVIVDGCPQRPGSKA